MRRFSAVLSLFGFAAAFAVLLLPHTIACPVSSPVPLRQLFIRSDIVVIGKIGAPRKWIAQPRSGDDTSRYETYNRAIPIQIEETIKGTPPKALAVTEENYSWPSAQQQANTPQEAGAARPQSEPEFSSTLADNKERRMFFLAKNDEGTSYSEVYSGHTYEFKQGELDVYISRLRELQNIYSSPSPSKEAIVEWLVGMAEDPITRWDGAYELRQALYISRDEEAEAETAEDENAPAGNLEAVSETSIGVEKDAAKENTEAVNTDAADTDRANDTTDFSKLEIITNLQRPPQVRYGFNGYDGDTEIAKLLTAGQKERLIHAFLNIRFNYKEAEKTKSAEGDGEDEEKSDPDVVEYEPVLSDADDLLMATAGLLNDRRVIDRLLYEIPLAHRYSPWQASKMISVAADYFADEKLTDLSEKYSNLAWGDDSDTIEYEEQAEDKQESNEVKNSQAVAISEADRFASNELQNARQQAYVRTKTYGQRRAELLQRFVTRSAELVVGW